MYNLEIGPLHVNLHRTVRVRDNNEASNLPPSLGTFEIYKVSDYLDKCPKTWNKDDYFIAMHSEEAMWISLQTCEPIAIVVGAGSINAINGNPITEKLEKDGYLVSPPQPWLDGWKGDDGTVYQFIATEVGENKTIGEQLAQTKDHAILISVFKAKNPEKLQAAYIPHGMWGDSEAGNLDYECCMGGGAIKSACCFGFSNEMGLGKGGKIKQKVYEDPHGLEVWTETPEKTVKIYLINASEFAEITGKPMSPSPVTAEQYDGIWYGLKDKQIADVPGTTIFDKLKSAIGVK